MIRPPPAGTPAQSVRTSAPHAERITASTSTGRIGRNTSGDAAGAPPAAGASGAAFAVAGAAPAAAGAAPPPAAATAFLQLGDSLASFFSRHCKAAAPPGVTLEQTFM